MSAKATLERQRDPRSTRCGARWLQTSTACPKGLIVRRARSRRPHARSTRTADIGDYSFDRAVICDRPETVDLLLANNFHFENNCAVLAVDGYPRARVRDRARDAAASNPRLEVFALHDATRRGCELAHRLATDERWFKGSAPCHRRRPAPGARALAPGGVAQRDPLNRHGGRDRRRAPVAHELHVRARGDPARAGDQAPVHRDHEGRHAPACQRVHRGRRRLLRRLVLVLEELAAYVALSPIGSTWPRLPVGVFCAMMAGASGAFFPASPTSARCQRDRLLADAELHRHRDVQLPRAHQPAQAAARRADHHDFPERRSFPPLVEARASTWA